MSLGDNESRDVNHASPLSATNPSTEPTLSITGNTTTLITSKLEEITPVSAASLLQACSCSEAAAAHRLTSSPAVSASSSKYVCSKPIPVRVSHSLQSDDCHSSDSHSPSLYDDVFIPEPPRIRLHSTKRLSVADERGDESLEEETPSTPGVDGSQLRVDSIGHEVSSPESESPLNSPNNAPNAENLTEFYQFLHSKVCENFTSTTNPLQLYA